MVVAKVMCKAVFYLSAADPVGCLAHLTGHGGEGRTTWASVAHGPGGGGGAAASARVRGAGRWSSTRGEAMWVDPSAQEYGPDKFFSSACHWYVQNISTFPNTFAVVSPLICVFWIQLTWTNAIFSRIALVARKNLEKYCKNPILPEDSRSQSTRRRGARRAPHHLVAHARLGCTRGWCGRPSHRLDPSFRLHIPSDQEISGVWRFSQIEFRCAATIRNCDSEPETLFWHPAGTGIERRSSSSTNAEKLTSDRLKMPISDGQGACH
jgi:hypothetical protein